VLGMCCGVHVSDTGSASREGQWTLRVQWWTPRVHCYLRGRLFGFTTSVL
jgi:hypothetical protein